MVALTAETCWAMNEYWINNKISGIKLVFSLYATMQYLLFSYGNYVYTNAPQCYVTRTLPFSVVLLANWTILCGGYQVVHFACEVSGMWVWTQSGMMQARVDRGSLRWTSWPSSRYVLTSVSLDSCLCPTPMPVGQQAARCVTALPLWITCKRAESFLKVHRAYGPFAGLNATTVIVVIFFSSKFLLLKCIFHQIYFFLFRLYPRNFVRTGPESIINVLFVVLMVQQ